MITIVMSTRQRNDAYIKRAVETSGVKNAQVLCYENNGQYSLTEVYNRGLSEATNDIVVFMHDDLAFDSGSNWGKKVITHFEDSPYGILGKAGSTELSANGVWWSNQNEMVGRVYHEMTHPQTGKKEKWCSEYSGHFGKNITPVVVVDGLFFAVHKQRIKKGFDETVKGFHFYEIAFCIDNYLESVSIGVVFDFPIAHKSIGETNDQWEENRKLFAEKYKDSLPVNVSTEIIVDRREIKIKKQPKVSIIVPTKGNIALITNLLESIERHTTYQNYEIIIADTGSTPEERETLTALTQAYKNAAGEQIARMVQYEYYNFAMINNQVVKNHVSQDSELIMFCNNDIAFVNDCLSLMVDTYLKNRHTCGTVGARLHFEDNKVQHAGIYLRQIANNETPFIAGHVGYRGSYQYQTKTYTVVGSTAALLLISKSLFEKIGYFNESYVECFEDVELNLQVLLRRHHNYLCGEAVAYHLESQTRKPGVSQVDMARLNRFIQDKYEKLNKYILQPNK